MSRLFRHVVLVLVISSSPAVIAQESNHIEFEDYTIHFNAFPSDHLQPHVAKAVGIERDPSRAVVTVVINKKERGKVPESVKAEVDGNAFNLSGMMRRMKLRELNDRGATYYISDFGVRNGERLTFAMKVKPEGEQREKEFKFTKQF